jgi:hypothetical protein
MEGVKTMKPGWWVVGLVTVAVGGTWLYLHHSRGVDTRTFHFVDDESALKNFGAFPPEMPEDEFDGVNFFS